MKTLRTILYAACLLVWFIIPALAADLSAPGIAPEGTWASVLIQYVLPPIAALLLGLSSIAIRWFGKKCKIDALTQENNYLESLAHQGISLAQERAAQYMAADRNKLTGQNKLSISTSYILATMPQITPERAQSIIESVLARTPGLGATGEAVVQAPAKS